jgi:methyl farnesoate epoxidase/farnesoate epoxidase
MKNILHHSDMVRSVKISSQYLAKQFLGKRRCLGESLAKANYFLFFTALLHNFCLEKDTEGPAPQLEGFDGVTISPKPFKAKLIPRSD